MKTYLNWSSGKDAAFALYKLQLENKYHVQKLVTTINSEVNRISMHGVRKELLLRQAKCLQLPLHIIPLPGNVSMAFYNETLKLHTGRLLAEGFTHSVFGDIFLGDLRVYREEELQRIGIKAYFPLWKADTHQLVMDIIQMGFKAITVCVNAKLLDRSFCGRIVDEQFLKDLPPGVDPCGENGEFHTFVYDGPNFKEPVKFQKGEVVEKFYTPTEDEDDCFSNEDRTWDTVFYYCDLLPT